MDPHKRTVRVRGIAFPVDEIRAAMLETGGVVVSDRELNMRLDKAIHEHLARGKGEPDMLFAEVEPGYYFVPKKIRIHRGRFDVRGTESQFYLYFAVPRKYNA